MAYPTSSLVITDRIGVEMMNKINTHFGDSSQHTGGGSAWPIEPASAYGISTSNTAAQNRTGLLSLANTNKSVYFPAGDYQVDNAAGFVNLGTFSGLLYFSPGARLVYNTVSKGGLKMGAGTRPVLLNLSTKYTTTPTVRVDGEHNLSLSGTIEPYVINYRADGGPSTGVTFGLCVRPRYHGGFVSNTMADGSQFANCTDPHITDYYAFNAGDDSLSLNNYAGLADAGGGYASGITVKNGHARGVIIGGHKNFTLENFYIDNTDGPGVLVQWDRGWNLRQPENAVVRNGTIVNSGGFTGSVPDMPEHWGVAIQECLGESVVENILIKNPGWNGLYCGQNRTGSHVTMRNIRVVDCASEGILVQLNASVHLENCQVMRSNNTGIRLASNARATFKDLTTVNCSLTNANKRAFRFDQWDHADSPATAYLSGEGVHVFDDQATPTGYRVEFSTVTGRAVDGDVGEVLVYTKNALPQYATFNVGANMTAKYSVRHAGSQSSRLTAAPTGGWWRVGEIVWNSAPTDGGNIGWVCTAQGNPGTWKAFGTIAA
jgi:Right handed beta helix region